MSRDLYTELKSANRRSTRARADGPRNVDRGLQT